MALLALLLFASGTVRWVYTGSAERNDKEIWAIYRWSRNIGQADSGLWCTVEKCSTQILKLRSFLRCWHQHCSWWHVSEQNKQEEWFLVMNPPRLSYHPLPYLLLGENPFWR
jgi:hypothetical protein